uniref:L-xylulose reductase-like n=1 Tax=Phallusia mammillata TaxID=59560 RepID=A0A6F9DAT5_9ASCI|nr:L-xylulose reductase-like [Phallusia mammillata]
MQTHMAVFLLYLKLADCQIVLVLLFDSVVKAIMNVRFDGKRALVTGAGKGIGREIVKKLVECGAETIALSRTQADLDSLKQECPSLIPIRCDLADTDSIPNALKDCGPIDLLVNNAGIAVADIVLDAKPADFDKSMTINVKAPIVISQIIAEGMIKRKTGGSIVNVSSKASLRGMQNYLLYAASKAALDSVTRTMSLELGPHNIRVNSVNPTVAKTDMSKAVWDNPANTKMLTSVIPLGRLAEISEVVSVILFLLSDFSSMVTGSCVPIDGGCIANLMT